MRNQKDLDLPQMRISNGIEDHLDSLQINEYILLPYES